MLQSCCDKIQNASWQKGLALLFKFPLQNKTTYTYKQSAKSDFTSTQKVRAKSEILKQFV